MIKLREFSASQKGPTLLVFGAIHGDEVCGARALQRLILELERGQLTLQSGKLVMVPVCNERAFSENKRYIDENLNRVFAEHPEASSHERMVANQLAPLLKNCDYFLDLHSMQSEGEAFAFLNEDTPASRDFAFALGMPWILKGWPELYATYPDTLSDCTQSYADKLKIPNVLVECGKHGAPEADEVAYQCTLRSLAHLGMAKAAPVRQSAPQFLELKDLFFREAEGDRFTKTWVNFEAVRKGELIGYRAGGKAEVSPRDGYIVFPSPVSAIGTEWFYVAAKL